MKNTKSDAIKYKSIVLFPALSYLTIANDLCVKIIQHISQGEARAAFPLLDELKHIRKNSNLMLLRQSEILNDASLLSTEDYRNFEQLKIGISILNKFDNFYRAWINSLNDTDIEHYSNATTEQWHINIEKRIGEYWDKQRDLLVIYGPPAQNLCTAIVERNQQRVIIVNLDFSQDNESEKAIEDANSVAYDLPAIDGLISKRFKIVRRVEDIGIVYPFRDPPYMLTEIYLPPYNDEREAVKPIQDEIRKSYISHKAQTDTVRNFGPIWFDQGFRNFPVISKSIPLASLSGHFKNIPLIIVSPGPSLEKNILDLKDAKGYAVIAAPAQSAVRLYQEGIHPDFIFVLDPSDYTSHPTEYLYPDIISPSQTLFYSATCHPNVTNLPYKTKVVYGGGMSSLCFLEFFNDPIINVSGTSVSVTALKIGIELGFTPIVLVGQDLAYSPEGYQYAGDRQKMSDGIFELAGYNGDKVSTPYQYKLAHLEFEEIARNVTYLDSSVQIINSTEGGARIDGLQQVPLRTAISMIQQDRVIIPEIVSVLISISDNFGFKNRVLHCRTRIESILHEISPLQESLQLCLGICSNLMKHINKEELELLSKTEELVLKNVKSTYFLNLLMQHELQDLFVLLRTRSNLEENIESSILLYETILRFCNLVVERLSEILEGHTPAQ